MSAPRSAYAGGATARYLLLGSATFLTLFGLVMIYSASSITAAIKEGSSWHYLVRQLMYIGAGALIAVVLARFDYRRLRPMSLPIWGAGVAALFLTLIIGVVRGGARRWIPLGFVNLQPSEFEKIACILLVAAFAVEWQRGKVSNSQFLARAFAVTAVPALLILLQPDMGTTLTLIVAVAIVLLLAGIDWRWIATAAGGVTALAVLAIAIEPYRMKRVAAFLDPWADPQGKGYQTIQALLAFGTGGIDGVGLGLSRQKFFYLPEAHTDFILAIIGEEVGLIGTLAVVVGLGLFVWSGFKIAAGSRDSYGRLVAGSVTGMLAFQAFLNMAAVTGVMPVTGKPLPFLSSGGSSMLVTMVCVGLLLSVSEFGALAPRALKRKTRGDEEPRRESAHERRRDRRPHLSRVDGGRATRRRA